MFPLCFHSVSTLFPLPVTFGHEAETKRKQISTSEASIPNKNAGYDGGYAPIDPAAPGYKIVLQAAPGTTIPQRPIH
jgi:hypothetical protein